MRAVIYNRCSTEEEAQINALEIQAAESREIVLSKGWQIVDQYIESESGTSTCKRTEYQRLIEDMEIEKFDVVVIKSIDRLMRSAMDWYLFIYKLTQYNKKLYIYIDHKFYTPDDSLMNGIKAILAEDFSRELSKKIRNAHRRRQNKKSGLNITRPMYGWEKVRKDVYEINEEEAANYRLAFALAKEGKGFYTIANIMYNKGVRGKNGRKISDVQWRKMIYSARAHGTVILHKREYDFDTKKYREIPPGEWIYVEDALPPIVSKEYQDEVLEAISCRTMKNKFKDYTRDMTTVGLYELSGKLVCAECGAAYYRTPSGQGKNRRIEWKCATALKQGRKTKQKDHGCNNGNVVEDTVLNLIEVTCRKHYETLFGDKASMIEETLCILRKVFTNNNHEGELAKLEKELQRILKKKRVLFDKLMEGIIEDKDFKQVNQELSMKLEQIQAAIDKLKIQNNKYDDYEERLLKIKASLHNEIIDKAKTKELISRIKKIIVYPDHTLEIKFDRVRLLSLIRICNKGFIDSEADDTCFNIRIAYVHKTKAERKREEVNDQIINCFKENSEAMLKDIPKLVGMSESYVNTSIKKLKQQGVLKYERFGNTHTGRWIVSA